MSSHSSFTTLYPLLSTHYSLLTVLPQNFYPLTRKLRHNPAAQGRIKVQPNGGAQPNPQTGRIQ
jgi:hypothetical protein